MYNWLGGAMFLRGTEPRPGLGCKAAGRLITNRLEARSSQYRQWPRRAEKGAEAMTARTLTPVCGN
jgi:hypothetical protein